MRCGLLMLCQFDRSVVRGVLSMCCDITVFLWSVCFFMLDRWLTVYLLILWPLVSLLFVQCLKYFASAGVLI